MTTRDGKPLSTTAEQIGRQLVRRVLTTTHELRISNEWSPDQIKRGMKELKKHGLVASIELGCLLPSAPRSYLTDEGLDYFGASAEDRSWHGPGCLVHMVGYDLPRLEAANAVAPYFATGGWRLCGTQLFERETLVAAAEYRHPDLQIPAYVLFCWASMMDRQADIYYRFRALLEGMASHAVDPTESFFPAGLAILAAEEWSGARALSIAAKVLSWWVPQGHTTAWYCRDGEWYFSDGISLHDGIPPEEVPVLRPQADLLRPVMSVRDLGRRRLENLARHRLRSRRDGRKLFELMTLVGNFPVGSLAQYTLLAGEEPEGRDTERRLKKLVRLGFAEVVSKYREPATPLRPVKGVPSALSKRGQRAHRYALTRAGRALYCHVHEGSAEDLFARTDLGRLQKKLQTGEIVDGWLYLHQDIVYDILGQASSKRCPFGPGWQAKTPLTGRKRIEPDGVLLVRTPWGRLWCYLEVELSKRSYLAVKPRCDKYGSTARRDDLPVLVVCHNDRAEANFHLAAAESARQPRMLTTTLRRLKEGGLFGTDVWSHHGHPVTLVP